MEDPHLEERASAAHHSRRLSPQGSRWTPGQAPNCHAAERVALLHTTSHCSRRCQPLSPLSPDRLAMGLGDPHRSPGRTAGQGTREDAPRAPMAPSAWGWQGRALNPGSQSGPSDTCWRGSADKVHRISITPLRHEPVRLHLGIGHGRPPRQDLRPGERCRA